MARVSTRNILRYFSGMSGMKWNVQMWKKMLCLSSGKSSKQKEYNTQIKQYKWTQRSGSKNITFFHSLIPADLKRPGLSFEAGKRINSLLVKFPVKGASSRNLGRPVPASNSQPQGEAASLLTSFSSVFKLSFSLLGMLKVTKGSLVP